MNCYYSKWQARRADVVLRTPRIAQPLSKSPFKSVGHVTFSLTKEDWIGQFRNPPIVGIRWCEPEGLAYAEAIAATNDV